MVEIPFLLVEALFTAVWLLVRVIVCAVKKKIDWHREAVLLLMYINLAVIIRFTFFPPLPADGKVLPLRFDASKALPLEFRYDPYRLMTVFDSKRAFAMHLICNFVLFVPSGIILPIVYKKLNRFWKTVAAGALISLCIEILQLPFYVRFSDIDDLIMNTLGTAFGYAVYAAVKRYRNRTGSPDRQTTV